MSYRVVLRMSTLDESLFPFDFGRLAGSPAVVGSSRSDPMRGQT